MNQNAVDNAGMMGSSDTNNESPNRCHGRGLRNLNRRLLHA